MSSLCDDHSHFSVSLFCKKAVWFRSKKICFKLFRLNGGLKDFVLFVYWKNQQEVIVCYYSYTTDSLTATTTTTFTTTIYLLLMALETRGLLQLLSRYNSKKSSIYATIHILHLLQLLLTLLRHTTDDMKWGVTAPLFSMSFLRYNNPYYYNNPGLEKHQDRGFLLIISRYNFKNAKVNVHIPHLIQ